jgi:hypothetical protein
VMQKKIECPRGIPEELCDHSPTCKVWVARLNGQKQA